MDKDTKESIEQTVTISGDILKTLKPEWAAYIVLGQSVATLMPTVYEDVVAAFSKNGEMSADERAEMRAKIQQLKFPETID